MHFDKLNSILLTGSNNGEISYNKLSYEHGNIKEIIESRKYTWTQVISGFENKNN